MNSDDAKKAIFDEITGKDAAAAAAFHARYAVECEQFAALMGEATIAWQDLAGRAGESDRTSSVSTLVYCAITLHVRSMKLFLAGHLLAAGNLSRQVVEAIATALLCADKTLNVLERFSAEHYSSQKAVRDLRQHHKALGIKEDSLMPLERAQNFYHHHSHLSLLTIGSVISFAEDGVYVGASFDEQKTDIYDKEIASRLSLATIFPSIVESVNRILAAQKSA